MRADESRGENVGVGDVEDGEELDDYGCSLGYFSCQAPPLA